MQKAFKWLDAKKIKYQFHNYKESGIDKNTLQYWLQHFATDKLINTRGTTFRELSEIQKASISNKAKAIALMIEHPSLIKRPVWDFGNDQLLLGWDEKEVSKRI